MSESGPAWGADTFARIAQSQPPPYLAPVSYGEPWRPFRASVERSLTEAALRPRLYAAMLDMVLLVVLLVPVELALRPGALSVENGVVSLIAGVCYFAGFEIARGQTPGKRRLGVRVVSATDGGPASAGRILVRNLARVVDGFPALYFSGLVSLLTTGRRHRQRIGDALARTVVIPADPARAMPAPQPWLLPLLAVVSLAAVATSTAVAISRAGNARERQFVAGCSHGGASSARCDCMYRSLTAAGYRTEAQWAELEARTRTALLTGAPPPPELVHAGVACVVLNP